MKDSDSYHLVLESHRWATLTWPLLCNHERVNLFSLDSEGGCSWQYVYRPDDWQGVPTAMCGRKALAWFCSSKDLKSPW